MRSVRVGQAGSIAVEFALVVPALMILLFGIFQYGIIYLAGAGLQHALGEGVREATLFPRRTDAQIIARIRDESFGLDPAQLAVSSLTHGTANDIDFLDITVSYTVDVDFMGSITPSLTLSRQKRVYLP